MHNFLKEKQEFIREILEAYQSDPTAMGFLSEVPEQLRESFALVLHNTEKDILKTNNRMGFMGLQEDVNYGVNIDTVPQLILPMLRKVWTSLIAHNIVSVQPMKGPRDYIGFINYSYGDNKGTTQKGDDIFTKFNSNYSSELVENEVKVDATNVDGVKQQWDNINNSLERIFYRWLPVRPYGSNGVTMFRVEMHWSVDDGSGNPVDHFAIDDGNGNFVYGGNIVGTINYEDGTWTLDLTGVGEIPMAGTYIWSKYYFDFEKTDKHWKAASGNVGETYGDRKTPTITVDYELKDIQAFERRLLIDFTLDAIENMMTYEGVDGSIDSIATIAARHIAKEIDEEILTKLRTGAAHTATWTYGPQFGAANTLNELDSIRMLRTIIDLMKARIEKVTKIPGDFFLVVPTSVAALFEQLKTHSDYMGGVMAGTPPSFDSNVAVHGIVYLMKLFGSYTVYKDPYMDDDKILIGMRNVGFDTGFIYAPFVPIRNAGYENIEEARIKTRLRTRYATMMVRPEYYGIITVNNLPTITTAP